MFERLIETAPEAAQIKNRKTYFLMSSLVLTVGLTTALIVSLFAVDLSLGSESFDMVELVAPVEPPTPEPEVQQPEARPLQQVKPVSQAAPKVPTRQVSMARVEESPREAPSTVSTVQNVQMERPRTGYYELGKRDADPVGGVSSGRNTDGPSTGSGLGDLRGAVAKVEEIAPPPPPPVKRDPPAPKKQLTQSLGVINGKARNLPKPIYSAAARAVSAQGQVSVKVLIDEKGNVVSATAVSGHPLLKSAAESAARNAQFSPTLLSGMPVKISGTIIYNFTS